MCAFKIFKRKRSRKYPIKRDESGKSARSRAFKLFEDGIRFDEISEEVGIKIDTVYKYHQQWMKNRQIEQQIKLAKELFKKTAPDRSKNIDLVTSALRITPDELEAILAKPHGLRSLVTQKFRLPAHDNMDHRLHISFAFALLISEHLTENGGKFQDVFVSFDRLLKQAKADRAENEDEIKRHNQWMVLAHRILAVDLDRERVVPDTFTPEERERAARLRLSKSRRELKVAYWDRLRMLMNQGLTHEQAREQIYQLLIDKQDIQGANVARNFLEEVDPLMPNDSKPPDSPKQNSFPE